MINPWLEIPREDYENHMMEVGQSQLLNELIKSCLAEYLPQNFALLGCATGNGLEHVSSETRNAYAIDINPDYLEVVRDKFAGRTNIKTIQLDIENEMLQLENIDLFFIGLVLEYVDQDKALGNLIGTLSDHGVMIIVMQRSKQNCFVSETAYKSLEKLELVSKEVDEERLAEFLGKKNYKLSRRRIIPTSEDKSFIVLEFSIK